MHDGVLYYKYRTNEPEAAGSLRLQRMRKATYSGAETTEYAEITNPFTGKKGKSQKWTLDNVRNMSLMYAAKPRGYVLGNFDFLNLNDFLFFWFSS